MVKNKVGYVVVVDFDGKPVGIVTERDILKKVTASNKPPREICSSCHTQWLTIKTYDSIETAAAAVIAKNKIKRLVVLEQGEYLKGMLSVTDIAKKLARILANDYKHYGHLKTILDF
jgi:CBS domain-containing protein